MQFHVSPAGADNPVVVGMSIVPTLRRSCLVALLVLAGPLSLYAQDVTEVTLKSAFLFNFARFTDWPNDALPADGTLSACVFGDRAVGEALTRAVKGKQVGRRPITVSVLAPNVSPPPCHLLYLSNVAGPRIAEIVAMLRDEPVLTVSDTDSFTKRGGIVQFFVESGKMRFRINARAAKRARLQLSSRLLSLAEVVEEDAQPVARTVPLINLLISAGPRLDGPLNPDAPSEVELVVWGGY